MPDWKVLVIAWILFSFPFGVIVGKFLKEGDKHDR